MAMQRSMAQKGCAHSTRVKTFLQKVSNASADPVSKVRGKFQ